METDDDVKETLDDDRAIPPSEVIRLDELEGGLGRDSAAVEEESGIPD